VSRVKRPGLPPPKGAGQTSASDGGRQAEVRVRTARQRTLSSTLWLKRQLNDPYVAEAKKLGYRSRAAFKLLQLDDKRIVDLGCAPGGWCQVALSKVGPTGRVVGIDYLPMDPVIGADILELDFLDPAAPERLRGLLDGPADIVLSDMAAPTTGHAATDHLRVMALAETAYDFATTVLAPGGTFVAKVFQGGTEGQLLDRLKLDFRQVRHAKPAASRADSAEIYVVASGFRGAAAADAAR
jgi:23S rRNA (uridine2552-2'-O)-methyltransferase